jgi:CyaY protein
MIVRSEKLGNVSTMNESEFGALADAALARLDHALEACDLDLDVQWSGSGMLEIEFSGGAQIVVNRHSAAQEIWVAARSGGFHFRWDGAHWRDTRDGRELFAALAALISQQSGHSVRLD